MKSCETVSAFLSPTLSSHRAPAFPEDRLGLRGGGARRLSAHSIWVAYLCETQADEARRTENLSS